MIALLVQGLTAREAGRQLGINPDQIYKWKSENPEFREMLAQAELSATEAIVAEGVRKAVRDVQDLMPSAQEKLAALLDHHDPRIRMQAISLIFRVGKPNADVNVNVGFEARLAQVQSASPVSGD